jgi:hypothetical protein
MKLRTVMRRQLLQSVQRVTNFYDVCIIKQNGLAHHKCPDAFFVRFAEVFVAIVVTCLKGKKKGCSRLLYPAAVVKQV